MVLTAGAAPGTLTRSRFPPPLPRQSEWPVMTPVKRRILCAEAREDVSNLISLLLQRKGYEVVTAQTVVDSLRLAAQEHFDLYILNDHYIDGDSIELCQKLRALDPSAPVLLFS